MMSFSMSHVFLFFSFINFLIVNNNAFHIFNEYSFSSEFIQEINEKAKIWQAGQNFPYNLTIHKLGQIIDLSKLQSISFDQEEIVYRVDNNSTKNIPKSFDAREEWHYCKNIKKIYDQGGCPSSYAFAVAPAFSDRRCILSGGKHAEPMSIEYLLSCCHACKYDDSTKLCGSGQAITAWWFIHKRGIISGGDYKSEEGCQPLSITPCKRRIYNETDYTCKGQSSPELKCHTRCTNEKYNIPYSKDRHRGQSIPELKCHTRCTNEKYNIPYSKDRHRGKIQYYVKADEVSIQREILTNGPVTAQITLYEDFFHYKSGVYTHTVGKRHDHMHTAKLIGWGEENDIPYWLLINSWGKKWGDKGTFKIRRGVFECNIEYYITAAIPKKDF